MPSPVAATPSCAPQGRLDDHVKKLFRALWGPAFGRVVLTKEQMESYRGLATTIHQNRLDFLYVDPGKPVAPQDKLRFKAAADRGIGYEVDELERCLVLGSAVEQAKAAVPGITLQDVVWMKNFCDLYLLILAMREVGLTVGDEPETDAARPDDVSGALPGTDA